MFKGLQIVLSLFHLLFSCLIVGYSFQDIIYFESSRRIIKIVSNSGTDVFYSRLNDIESTIAGDFIRIHQSYLVNPRYIASLNGNEIYLTNGVKLPVSKPRLANVKEELLRIFAEKM